MNSATDVWSEVLNILSVDLTTTAISTWFDECRAVEVTGSRLYLHTPSSFKKGIIEQRFSGTIQSALGELFSGKFDFVVLDDDDLAKRTKSEESVLDSSVTQEYTFEQFIVGSTNKFAHAAAVAVANGRQKQDYNPLFIYGESGLGKTHLLHAIRHAIGIKFPHYHIVYAKGDDFLNELIDAIQLGKNIAFRDKFRGADMFLMDDVQFIAGKIQTQEEFFHTFNTLFELGKQIVFTSDRPPSEIYTLEDRLRSRFESGLLADIQPPDDALRVAIIKNKAEQLGVVLPDDVINYISDNMTSNIRQLEGAVKLIIACRDIMGEDISVDMVIKRLKDMLNDPKEMTRIVDVIIEETAKFYMLSVEDVVGQRRTRNTTQARQIAMYLIRKMTNLSLKDVGELFHGRDHTTVISSIRKVETSLEKTPEYTKIIRDLTSNIHAKN